MSFSSRTRSELTTWHHSKETTEIDILKETANRGRWHEEKAMGSDRKVIGKDWVIFLLFTRDLLSIQYTSSIQHPNWHLVFKSKHTRFPGLEEQLSEHVLYWNNNYNCFWKNFPFKRKATQQQHKDTLLHGRQEKWSIAVAFRETEQRTKYLSIQLQGKNQQETLSKKSKWSKTVPESSNFELTTTTKWRNHEYGKINLSVTAFKCTCPCDW